MLKEPYKPRSISFLELWQENGWRIKVYGITYGDKVTTPELLEATREAARKVFPQPAVSPDHYGVGFIGIHEGRSYDFVFMNYWEYDTELHHVTFTRPSSLSYTLEPLSEGEISSDVWDIRLLAFERDAWVEEVLTKADEESLARYLSRQLNETV